MRYVILSLLTVLGLSTQVARAEESSDVSVDTQSTDHSNAREGRRYALHGQWVFLGCVANDYQCQAIGARQGFRFRSAQQNRAYCGGGYPGGWGGGYPGGWGGGYPGGWGGGYPGGWGGGHHRGPGGWGGGHHRGRIAPFATSESSESSDEDGRDRDARTHRGGFAGFACFGAR